MGLTYAVGRLNDTVAVTGRRFDTWDLRLEDWRERWLVPSHGWGRLCALRIRPRCWGYGSGLLLMLDSESEVVGSLVKRVWAAIFGKKIRLRVRAQLATMEDGIWIERETMSYLWLFFCPVTLLQLQLQLPSHTHEVWVELECL